MSKLLKGSLSQDDKRLLRKLALEGIPPKRIAEMMNRPLSTIYRNLLELGIKVKEIRPAKKLTKPIKISRDSHDRLVLYSRSLKRPVNEVAEELIATYLEHAMTRSGANITRSLDLLKSVMTQIDTLDSVMDSLDPVIIDTNAEVQEA